MSNPDEEILIFYSSTPEYSLNSFNFYLYVRMIESNPSITFNGNFMTSVFNTSIYRQR